MKEIELKILVSAPQIPALRRRIAALGEAKPRTRRLRTIYLDTAEGGLAAAGHALRLRVEARRWTQTVKTAREMRAGLSSTEEINTPAPGGRVDLDALPPPIRETVRTATAGLPLAPVFETVVSRSTWMIAVEGARIEVALDRGEIVAGERREGIDELELELIEGPASALFEAARAMFPTGPLRFSTMNKAARGQRVAAGQAAVEAPVPRHAAKVEISRKDTAEAAARAILTECFLQVSSNIVAVGTGGDPEGPHQLRVGLRRLRSALQLFAPVLAGKAGNPRFDTLLTEARWLGREVGRLRDLDVAGTDLLAPAAKAIPREPGFARLAEATAARAAEERVRLRETLAGPRVTALLFDLAEYLSLRGWLDPTDHAQTARLAQPFCAVAAAAAAKADRKAAKRAKNIATLEHEARHDLRKALKALRYIIEFGAPCWPEKRTKPLLKTLRGLQTLFGELNDAAMAEELFLAPNAPAADDPLAARAAGRLIGGAERAADHAWEMAKTRWDGFAATKRPWA
ncbi:MAG: CYTH and CHAD domain-containing protein [Pseudomonadota bacterium]